MCVFENNNYLIVLFSKMNTFFIKTIQKSLIKFQNVSGEIVFYGGVALWN